jgi:hypothetical protein
MVFWIAAAALPILPLSIGGNLARSRENGQNTAFLAAIFAKEFAPIMHGI